MEERTQLCARGVFDFVILPSISADREKIEIWEEFVENRLFEEVSISSSFFRRNIFKKKKKNNIFRDEEYSKELREKVPPVLEINHVKHELLTNLWNFRQFGKMHETWRSICGTFKTKQEIGMWRDYLRLRFLQDVPPLEQSTTIGAADVQKLHEMWESMSADLSWDDVQIESQKHELKCIFESDLKVVKKSIIASENKKLLETWKNICGAIKTEQEMAVWNEYLNHWFLQEVPSLAQSSMGVDVLKLRNLWEYLFPYHTLYNNEDAKEILHSEFKEILEYVGKSGIAAHHMNEAPNNQFRRTPEEGTIATDMERLRNIWNSIRATLKDAEEMEIWKESVKQWLQELRNLASHAEDIINIYDYNLLQAKIEGDCVQMEAQQVACEMSTINEKFEDIAKRREALRLKKKDGKKKFESMCRLPSGSIPVEDQIFGRDEDMEKLVGLLTSTEMNFNVPATIVMVGMAGVGKTTLAQHVYNDQRISTHFEKKGWVNLTEEFDVLEVFRAAVESLTGCPANLTQLAPLQNMLMEVVQGKKILLILDNVWNENRQVWDTFKHALRVATTKESRILVTTRSQHVAHSIQANHSYPLGRLTEDQCWLLLKKYAFCDKTREDDHSELVKIGKAIIKKCNCLPLAVKVLGGVLAGKETKDSWNYVLENEIWEVDEKEILGALQLSYLYLPSELKPCFTYCSVFPKGFKINKEYLVRLWMAQGLLGQDKASKMMEDKGMDYVDELLWRSFFQQAMDENLKEIDQEHVVMHDLIHYLARYFSGEKCESLITQDDKKYLPLRSLSTASRHSSFVVKNQDEFDGKGVLYPPDHPTSFLRTILVLQAYKPARGIEIGCDDCQYLRALDLRRCIVKKSNFSSDKTRRFFHKFKLLRYLNLSGCELSPLPKSVCSLYYLQTLDLRYTKIVVLPDNVGCLQHLRHLHLPGIHSLPESIGRLHYLQTLDVDAMHIIELPKCILNLANLRCLKASAYMPKGIGRLTKLQNLDGFKIGHSNNINHAGITELEDLVDLKDIHIEELNNVVIGEDADLKNKEFVLKLVLDWDMRNMDARDAEETLEALQPHPVLEELQISYYPGTKLPSWMGHSSFSKLISVEMSSCPHCEVISCFGQLLSLQSLTLVNMSSLKEVDHKFHKNNRSIVRSPQKPLKLVISGCPMLMSLRASAVDELYIISCEYLASVDFDASRFHESEFYHNAEQCLFPKKLWVAHCPLLKVWCEKEKESKLKLVPTIFLGVLPNHALAPEKPSSASAELQIKGTSSLPCTPSSSSRQTFHGESVSSSLSFVDGQEVNLLSDDPNMIVAHGRVCVTDSTMVIGGTKLGKKYIGVCVEDVMKEDEELHRPYAQYETIGDAIGAIIAWPIKSVNLTKISEFQTQNNNTCLMGAAGSLGSGHSSYADGDDHHCLDRGKKIIIE